MDGQIVHKGRRKTGHGASAQPIVRRRFRKNIVNGSQIYSALDLGTNNCRLLIAKPDANGFRVVDAFSRIVRLGEGLTQSGVLSDLAMNRTIDALKTCADKVQRRQVTLMRNVATQACRMAENCSSFVDRVRDETGLALDVISAKEEARLAVLGCKSLLDEHADKSLVFDIGGGSTELIVVSRDGTGIEILDWVSLPIGVVTLAEQFGIGALTLQEYAAMVTFVRDALSDFHRQCTAHGDIMEQSLLGTSGTVTTLASLELGLKTYDRRKVDGAYLHAKAVRKQSSELAVLSWEERARYGCIGNERADLVVSGCAILEAILDLWPVEKLRVADRGIREGVLRSLMDADGHEI